MLAYSKFNLVFINLHDSKYPINGVINDDIPVAINIGVISLKSTLVLFITSIRLLSNIIAIPSANKDITCNIQYIIIPYIKE